MGLLPGIYRQNRLAGKGKPGLALAAAVSGKNLDRGAVGDGVPDLYDREISDGNAALGPIAIPFRRVERAVIARQAVNKDRAARIDMRRPGTLTIPFVGIGDVEPAGVAGLGPAPIRPVDRLPRS